MKQKNMNPEEELAKAMELLYSKHVPPVVRNFIDMRSGIQVEITERKANRKEETGC